MQRLSIFSASVQRFSMVASLQAPSRICLSTKLLATTPVCRVNARLASQYPSMVTGNLIRDSIKPTKKDQTIEERWKERSRRAIADAKNSPPAHAYTGRTVPVRTDLARAYKQLDIVLQRNKVRQTLRLTERHEKKGVKRRRLSSQRWRKQFANEVRKKVQLVMKIRDRGA